MRYEAILFLLSILFSIPTVARVVSMDDFKLRWQGTEVIGTDPATAEVIRTLIPLKKDEIYFEEMLSANFKTWCGLIEEKTNLRNTKCSFIAYQDGRFYYIVEIIPKDKLSFRKILSMPSNVSVTIPSKLKKLFDEYDEKLMLFFKTNIPFKETYVHGYPDYDHPELHAYVQKLVPLARKYNHTLLNVISYSKNPKDRATAALILPFSNYSGNVDFIIRSNFINDPDTTVRNNISRYIAGTFKAHKDKKTMERAIPAFCQQAALPFLTDRNKSLVSLYQILKTYPELSSSIKPECRNTVADIANTSIVHNIGGIATSILEILKENSDD